MDAILTGDGAKQMADQDVCIAVFEDLAKQYPGYPWCVGCNHEAGTVVIDLMVDKPPHLRNYAYQLYLSTVLGAEGQKKVMRAGGELLERFGLQRGWAHPDTAEIAREHGLITDHNKNKSKH